MEFDIREDKPSIIKVIGVGGGGCNAVTHMYRQGITGVNFVICNTDQQALDKSPVPTKVKLGPSLTEGLGAGANPEVGRKATIESADEIRDLLSNNTRMVFVTAGMGGGTGTGGAPVVAKIAKEMGILTVGIATIPFTFEGSRKIEKAYAGIEELKQNVDALILISNNKLKEIFGDQKLSEVFAKADDVLSTAARGISEIITKPGLINVDFEDVKTVMQNSGVAIMGASTAVGDSRALRAIDDALSSPLLDDNNISGAKGILLYITSGKNEVTMDEITQITDFVQRQAGNSTEIIWGVCTDEELDEELSVTVIATGFEPGKTKVPAERVVHKLEERKYTVEVEFESTDITMEGGIDLMPEPEPVLRNLDPRPYQHTEATREMPETPISEVVEDPVVQRAPQPRPEPQPRLFGGREESPADAEYQRMMREKHQSVKSMAQRNLHSSPGNLFYLENQPAYERRNVQLKSHAHSSQSNVSKYTLDLNGEEAEIKTNNRFLDERAD